jgi:tetratricopeptide (TPR) repeat protein
MVEADRYKEAIALINELNDIDASDPIVNLFRGLCSYENGDDLECMMHLLKFLSEVQLQPKTYYALFTFAVCLENIGMYKEALRVLEALPNNYPGREDEVRAVTGHVEKQEVARNMIEELDEVASSIKFELR